MEQVPKKTKSSSKLVKSVVLRNPQSTGVEGIVQRTNQQWQAVYRRNAFECRSCNISPEDAWNFDIVRGLPVTLDVDETGPETVCRITRRKGNKMFVRVLEIKE